MHVVISEIDIHVIVRIVVSVFFFTLWRDTSSIFDLLVVHVIVVFRIVGFLVWTFIRILFISLRLAFLLVVWFSRRFLSVLFPIIFPFLVLVFPSHLFVSGIFSFHRVSFFKLIRSLVFPFLFFLLVVFVVP